MKGRGVYKYREEGKINSEFKLETAVIPDTHKLQLKNRRRWSLFYTPVESS